MLRRVKDLCRWFIVGKSPLIHAPPAHPAQPFARLAGLHHLAPHTSLLHQPEHLGGVATCAREMGSAGGVAMSTASSKTYQWRRVLFISAVVAQLILVTGSIALISSMRVLISGESLWSKGLSASFMHLRRYADTGALQDF